MLIVENIIAGWRFGESHKNNREYLLPFLCVFMAFLYAKLTL
jgi:hypothetical protein